MPIENRDVISTTQLGRNLSAAIDEVRIRQRPLAITKGKRTVAELRPPPQPGYPVSELAQWLNQLPSLGKDADRLADDVAKIRRCAALPESPWGS